MQGTMMNFPLTLTHVLERAGKFYPRVEIVSRRPDRSLHRYTYADFYGRARALAGALQNAGLQAGDRVATLMWNHHVHLEAYFGVPTIGGVVHTLNLRLSAKDLTYIVKHAGDRFLIVDDVLLPLYEKFKNDVSFERVIVVSLTGAQAPPDTQYYEDFLQTANANFQFPVLEENQAAAMCYTSGTTGTPKGVVYTHRSLILHSLFLMMAGGFGLSDRDTYLPIVPMFHANAWGFPFAATLAGAKHVYPGPCLDAENLLNLFEQEKVTVAGGVPTVWMSIIDALEKHPGRWKLQPMRTMVGGAAPPESLIRKLAEHGIELIQGWGLTESSPIATCGVIKACLCDSNDTLSMKAKAGIPVPFVEMRVVSDEGEAPWDGQTMGEVELRGPWVASSYYNLPEEKSKWTDDGWFRTGDVGTIDPEGYLKITDRTKDLIKSGGEWISSVDLENAIVAHPEVREAAVIAVPHPKWQERPIAVVVARDGAKLTQEDLRNFLACRFAKWQLPEAFVFVDELPHTSTGKLLKMELRNRYRDWNWE